MARVAKYVALRRYVNVVREKVDRVVISGDPKKYKNFTAGCLQLNTLIVALAISFIDTVFRSNADRVSMFTHSLSRIEVSRRLPLSSSVWVCLIQSKA